jgi:ribonuclease HI
MELTAAIEALAALKRRSKVAVHTDSSYVKDGITSMDGELESPWLEDSRQKPVKNKDLWEQLDAQILNHDVAWHWVKGHAGDAMNERADELARAGMAPFKPVEIKMARLKGKSAICSRPSVSSKPNAMLTFCSA